MGFGKFLKTRRFWLNLTAILAFFLLLVFLVIEALGIYTNHGDEYKLPNVEGLSISEIKESSDMKPFEIIIIDSIFTEGKPSGVILKQDPTAGTKVKSGRKIYVIVTSSTGEIIAMPNCTDQSVKMAVQQLAAAGLRIGSLIFRSGYISNIVVDQKYEGKHININAKIKRGSAIDLIIEIASDNTTTNMPNILGMTETEAEIALWSSSLNVGTKSYEGKKDTEHSRVVSFEPPYKSFTIGSAVSLIFANDTKAGYKTKLESFKIKDTYLDTNNVISNEEFIE